MEFYANFGFGNRVIFTARTKIDLVLLQRYTSYE